MLSTFAASSLLLLPWNGKTIDVQSSIQRSVLKSLAHPC